MADTDFSQFNPGAVNIETDAAYQGDSTRTGGITFNQILSSLLGNKFFYQTSTFVRAWALSLVGKGFSPKDGTSPYTADASSNAAVTALKTVLDNVLTNSAVDLVGIQHVVHRDTTVVNHHASSTLDTIYTYSLPANSLGATGSISILIAFDIALQGGPVPNVTVNFGAQSYNWAFPVAPVVGGIGRIECLITNKATGAQIVEIRFQLPTALAGALSQATTYTAQTTWTVDTTAAQTLSLQFQSGTSTDSQDFNLFDVRVG